jgi:hypothetical protein
MKIPSASACIWRVGVARRVITPDFHVELAGLGYYLNRTPTSVRDNLTATALVIEDAAGNCVALAALDIMYGDEAFTSKVRADVASRTDIRPEAVCINWSHTHNAPTIGNVRGAGAVDPNYVRLTASATADAIVEAWRKRQTAWLRVGSAEAKGMAFNRTRENGPVDTRLAVLRADTLEGKPLALAVNFHSHLNAHLDFDTRAISRDWSGEMIDIIEAALPGIIALYLQGTCGDVMVSPEFCSTARRFEPGREIAHAALEACDNSRPVSGTIACELRRVKLPARRWTMEEINSDREEALYRLKTGDTTDWLNGFARVIVTYPDRLARRYNGSVEKAVAAVSRFGVEWTDAILPSLETRPEIIETEVQATRIGDVWLVAHGTELFTPLGLAVRKQWPAKDLLMLGYSNSAIGYLPDAFDVRRNSYAANQSPKFMGQFPFTENSGDAMVAGLLDTLNGVKE